MLFLNRVKWLPLDRLIVEQGGGDLGEIQLSSLLLHINCNPERLREEPRVTHPVGDLGYFREQMSPDWFQSCLGCCVKHS